GELLLADEVPAFAVLLFVLVRATVVMEAQAALFDVPLGGDRITAGVARGEIEESKAFVASPVAETGFADRNESLLDVVKGLFGDHRGVNALVHFALVEKHAVIEGIAKHIPDG